MARTNNLTNFLTDVASAIKQKTGDNTPIPANQFDIEILAIPAQGTYQEKEITITENGNFNLLPDSGYDAISNVRMTIDVDGTQPMDPTTATVDDVIAPETFYSNGRKQQGRMQVTYDTIPDAITYEQLKIVTSPIIRDVNETYGLAITTAGTSSTYFRVYRYSNGELGDLLSTIYLSSYTSDVTLTSIQNISVSQVLDTRGYLIVHATDNARMLCVEINPNTGEAIQGRSYSFTNTSYTNFHCMAINPVYPNICVYAYWADDDGYSTFYRYRTDLVRYNVDTNTITRYGDYWDRQNNQGYNLRVQWDQSGLVVMTSSSYTSNLLYRIQRWNNTFTSRSDIINLGNADGDGRSKCLYKDDYIFSGNTLRRITSYSTIIKTYSNQPEIINNSLLWTYGDFLFNLNRTQSILYAYKITVEFDLELIFSIPMSNFSDLYSYGGWFFPQTNHVPYFVCNTAIVYHFTGTSEFHRLKTLNRNGLILYNTDDVDVIPSQILNTKTAYNQDGKITGTMPNRGAIAYTPSTSQQSIASGYHNGSYIRAVTSSIDINIIPENIKNGVIILGILGTYQGSQGGDATSDASLQAKYLLEGYSAVVDGQLIQGTMHDYGNHTITPTSSDITIPEGHYLSLSIPIINAVNCEDYDLCSQAIDSI